MRYAAKKPVPVHALRLGAGSPGETRLLAEGKLCMTATGDYRVFSLEATTGQGELARPGDYVKFSSDGWPYPNDRAFFEANHRQISEELYEQRSHPLPAWTAEDGIAPEIDFLLDHKGLAFHPETPDAYFSAPLWGTTLTAGKDAVIVFYSITRDSTGAISDAEFNFVARAEFDLTYDWIDKSDSDIPSGI